jgi:pimeloyl-ACP methyl ester carboxylesterase
MKSDSIQTPPQGHFATVNGFQMYYEVYGEGSPLVLLHGFAKQSSLFWQPYVATLAIHAKLIVVDLRGHGRSTNPTNQFTHGQSALDIFTLLDQLEIDDFKAIGVSSGGMTLLHMATQQPERVESMVLVGATSYFPAECRAIQRDVTVENTTVEEWDMYREHHYRGDEQIRMLINQFRNFADSYDDMNFTARYLTTIRARTLIVPGDRDLFFPVSIPVEMYTSIPNAYLWIVPNGDHVPITGEHVKLFTQTALEFLQGTWD